jgi:hypothetical protein
MWQRLRLCNTLLAEQLDPLVTHWPPDAWVEVRECGSCGKPIAQIERRRPG